MVGEAFLSINHKKVHTENRKVKYVGSTGYKSDGDMCKIQSPGRPLIEMLDYIT